MFSAWNLDDEPRYTYVNQFQFQIDHKNYLHPIHEFTHRRTPNLFLRLRSVRLFAVSSTYKYITHLEFNHSAVDRRPTRPGKDRGKGHGRTTLQFDRSQPFCWRLILPSHKLIMKRCQSSIFRVGVITWNIQILSPLLRSCLKKGFLLAAALVCLSTRPNIFVPRTVSYHLGLCKTLN